MSSFKYLGIGGSGLLDLGSVPLLVHKLGGADIILLGLVGSGQWRVGGELLPQTVHQLFESGPLRHRASVELALVGHLGDKDLHEVDLPILVQSRLLLLLHIFLKLDDDITDRTFITIMYNAMYCGHRRYDDKLSVE